MEQILSSVKSILETELIFLEERHKEGQGMYEAMGALSPAFGMIGYYCWLN